MKTIIIVANIALAITTNPQRSLTNYGLNSNTYSIKREASSIYHKPNQLV